MICNLKKIIGENNVKIDILKNKYRILEEKYKNIKDRDENLDINSNSLHFELTRNYVKDK